jgi:colicin import membrane protein
VKRTAEQPAALEKRAQPGKVRAVILALFVHALFFGFIVVGVTWQSSPTPPVEAELWDKLPPVAAKPPPRPEPPPPEPPKPEPPKPEPPKPEPPKPEPAKAEPPKPDPEIALKAEREKRERERKAQEEAKKKREELEAKKKREELEAAKKKHEQEEAEKKKREDDKRKREEEKRRREEEIAKREAERARAAQVEARQKEFNEYVSRIRAKIKSRANVPDSVTGKPTVQMQIRILPGGEVLDIRVIKPSGNRAYDTAIERAIRSASPLPVPDVNSELFPQFREPILNFEHER